jgi:hypothetical protein
MKKCAQGNGEDKVLLENLLGRLGNDGTHPDFPVKKFVNLADWTRLPWSELSFDLPALVVYGLAGQGEPPAVGVVFAVGNSLEGTEILAVSKKGEETRCHPAGLSPEGKRPAYLLVKKHLSLASAP